LSLKEEETANQEEDGEEEEEAEAKQEQSNAKNLTPLQQKMQKQLAGAKFRQLNELLYTIPSADAYSQFQSNPQLFDDYHTGFSSQTEGWPLNPNDVFINFLKSQKSDRTLFVADMGCGEAKIAENLQTYKHIKINSFDLVKGNKFITPCDIRNVPLKNKTCDFVIFSLSLMGVNYFEFLKEAKRLLRQK
jgi:ribosomal RNA-processing protein 8